MVLQVLQSISEINSLLCNKLQTHKRTFSTQISLFSFLHYNSPLLSFTQFLINCQKTRRQKKEHHWRPKEKEKSYGNKQCFFLFLLWRMWGSDEYDGFPVINQNSACLSLGWPSSDTPGLPPEGPLPISPFLHILTAFTPILQSLQ